MKSSFKLFCLCKNIKDNLPFLHYFNCNDEKKEEPKQAEEETKQAYEPCPKCEKNEEIDGLINTNSENLFYYIDKLDADVLESHFVDILEKIESDAGGNKNRALVCFDRLLARLGEKVDFSKLDEISEKDERFRLIIVNHKNVPIDMLKKLCSDDDKDVRKIAICKLKKEQEYEKIDKWSWLDLKYLGELKDAFSDKEIKAEEEKRKAEEAILSTITEGKLKLLLYIAKAISLDCKAAKITLKSIKDASGYVIFNADMPTELATIICENIGDSKDKKARYDFVSWLVEAFLAPKIDYDDDVKALVAKLKPFADTKICRISESAHAQDSTFCERLKTLPIVAESAKENSATSKDILLLAKWIAHTKGVEKITQRHIQRASASFDIIDDELKNLLATDEKFEAFEAIAEKIKEAGVIDKMTYDDRLKETQLLQWLNANKNKTVGSCK